MIYTVTLNPALDKTVEIPSLTVDTVNRITQMRTDPGGKGINVSKVIQSLGGQSIALGILGGHTGLSVQNALTQMGLATDFIFVNGETRTNLKIIDPVHHTNTDINEPGVTVSGEILRQMLTRLLDRLKPDDIVVISGSAPKGCPGDTYYIWTRAAAQKGARVFLDADGELLRTGLQASPFLIKPNRRELFELIGQPLSTPEALTAAARSLREKYKIRKVVVSMGREGALYITEKESLFAEGLKIPTGSTVGAGDSMVAALAVAEEKGLPLEETVRLSTAAGASSVMCSGTQAADYKIIKELLPKVRFHKIY